MTRRAVHVFLLVCVFALGWTVGQLATKEAFAQAQARRVTIPKSYGAFRAAHGETLLFEDSAGTIRVVGEAKGQLYAEYSRQ